MPIRLTFPLKLLIVTSYEQEFTFSEEVELLVL